MSYKWDPWLRQSSLCWLEVSSAERNYPRLRAFDRFAIARRARSASLTDSESGKAAASSGSSSTTLVERYAMDGAGRAYSIVANPHKRLFTLIDVRVDKPSDG